jgi:cytoskeletal protein CcmA (bactofilin family)
MWRKTDGKPSSDVPEPPAETATKFQVTPEPPASSTASSAPVTSAPASASRAAVSEAPLAPASPGTSRIQAGLKIHGEISGNSDLYIDGELQGKIRLGSARVVIGPNAKVQADIEAGGITIDGSVQGNLKASESVRLGPSSRVQGSVVTPRIGIDDGARLRGKVEMVKAGSPMTASAPASTVTRAPEPEALRPVSASAKDE